MNTHQNISVLDVEVEEEEESDEEAQEGDGGALPQTPHFVQGLPQQPHAALLSRICKQGHRGHMCLDCIYEQLKTLSIEYLSIEY